MVMYTGLEPVVSALRGRRPMPIRRVHLVGMSRFELLTPALSARCSNQLSYIPIYVGTLVPTCFYLDILSAIELATKDSGLVLTSYPHALIQPTNSGISGCVLPLSLFPASTCIAIGHA